MPHEETRLLIRLSLLVMNQRIFRSATSEKCALAPYDPSPCLPFSTLAQLECLSTMPLSRSTSWKPNPYQTQSQSTMLMELQMRMDPLWRRSRSYSDTASTWRRHALQLQTSGNKPSSLDTCGLPITTQRSTGLARASACLNAP